MPAVQPALRKISAVQPALRKISAVQPALRKISTTVLGGVSGLTELPNVLNAQIEESYCEVHHTNFDLELSFDLCL